MDREKSSVVETFDECELRGRTVSLCQLNPGKRCNILVFGPKGSGKSNVIVALSTDENEDDVVVVKENQEISPTEKYTSYNLNEFVRIFDCWGWRMNNYKGDEFEKMLDGRIEEESGPKDVIQSVSMKHRIIDFVLFVIDVDTDEEHLRSLTPFVDLAKKKKRGVITLINKVDKLIPNEKIEPKMFCSLIKKRVSKVEEQVKSICNCGNVFPIFHYTNERERNRIIRRMKVPIIDCILNVSSETEEEDDDEKQAVDQLLSSSFGLNSKRNDENDGNKQIFSVIMKEFNTPRKKTSERERKSLPRSLGEENALDALLAMSSLSDDNDGFEETPSSLEEMADRCEILRSPGGRIIKISCGGGQKK